MAEYVVVDKSQLEADLTTVADAIRSKGGTTESLAFPLGMKEAVENIETGITPTGTIEIIENGTYDIVNYASAEVHVRESGNAINELEEFMLHNIVEFSSDKVTMIKSNFFQSNTGIEKISTPNAVEVMSFNYYGCTNLKYVDAGKAASLLNAFIGSHKLEIIILRKTDSITVLKNAISNSNNLINGITFIYVPAALLEEYKNATNWSVFADQYRPLEDYTTDGTATGTFDINKVQGV